LQVIIFSSIKYCFEQILANGLEDVEEYDEPIKAEQAEFLAQSVKFQLMVPGT